MSGATGGAGNAATSGANSAAGNCSQAMLAPRRLWRLTPEQYDSTVRDLLGAQSEFGAGFPADSVFKGFRNNAESLLVTPLLADKL